MASLAKKVFLNPVLLNNGIHRLQFVRLAAYWNKDWKPGPYPKTDEERIAAAKKYGLLPQDYEPYPDDGAGFGDYPKLPVISNDQKDPNGNWDDPDIRRNFGEPMSYDYDKHVEERITTGKPRYTMAQQWASFLGVVGAFFGLYFLFEYNDWTVKYPRIGKQYPNAGQIHYTFEEAE